MEGMYKNLLLLLGELTNLSQATYELKCNPTEQKAKDIIEKVNECENKFLKVKEEIAIIMSSSGDDENINEDSKISAIKTDNGFLITKE